MFDSSGDVVSSLHGGYTAMLNVQLPSLLRYTTHVHNDGVRQNLQSHPDPLLTARLAVCFYHCISNMHQMIWQNRACYEQD